MGCGASSSAGPGGSSPDAIKTRIAIPEGGFENDGPHLLSPIREVFFFFFFVIRCNLLPLLPLLPLRVRGDLLIHVVAPFFHPPFFAHPQLSCLLLPRNDPRRF